MVRPNLNDLPSPSKLGEGFVLRAATRDDSIGLAETLTSAFPEDPWDADRVIRELIDAGDVDTCYVITHGGNIVATTSVQMREIGGNNGTIHWVGCRPGYFGNGFGKALIIACMHRFVELGFTQSNLSTDDHRLPAIRLYLSLGYVPDTSANESHEARWKAVMENLQADQT